ncbi:MAG: hypothetical protein ORO03_08575, partial [Alphaproteobacteria bacterium]|nr:hypothetical protein [Alphaproteobacteria bacterium]
MSRPQPAESQDPPLPRLVKVVSSLAKLAKRHYRAILIAAAAVSCGVGIYLVNGRTSFDGYLYDILVAER